MPLEYTVEIHVVAIEWIQLEVLGGGGGVFVCSWGTGYTGTIFTN